MKFFSPSKWLKPQKKHGDWKKFQQLPKTVKLPWNVCTTFFSLTHVLIVKRWIFFDQWKTFRFLSKPKVKNIRRKKTIYFSLLKKFSVTTVKRLFFFLKKKYFKLSAFSKVFLCWIGEEGGLKSMQENKRKTQDRVRVIVYVEFIAFKRKGETGSEDRRTHTWTWLQLKKT